MSLTCCFVCLAPLLMEVIRRAPHEFKIACLEVTATTQNHVTVIYNRECYWKASSYRHYNTYGLNYCYAGYQKTFPI